MQRARWSRPTQGHPGPRDPQCLWTTSFRFAMWLFRSTVGLQVDPLTLNPRLRKGFQRLLGQVRRQFDQRVVLPNADMAEIAAVQAALVGDGTDDGTRHYLVPLANCDAIGSQVVANLAPLAGWTVLAGPAAGTFAPLFRRWLRHQELFAV